MAGKHRPALFRRRNTSRTTEPSLRGVFRFFMKHGRGIGDSHPGQPLFFFSPSRQRVCDRNLAGREIWPVQPCSNQRTSGLYSDACHSLRLERGGRGVAMAVHLRGRYLRLRWANGASAPLTLQARQEIFPSSEKRPGGCAACVAIAFSRWGKSHIRYS